MLRNRASEALRTYNQYYIFHRHLHSYCKWLVSKIITGCIRNLGFAISLLVLGGPVNLPLSPPLSLPLSVSPSLPLSPSTSLPPSLSPSLSPLPLFLCPSPAKRL